MMNQAAPDDQFERTSSLQPQLPTGLGKVQMHVREDGVFPFVLRAFASASREARNRLLGSRLRAPNFRIGRAPKLRGLAHITVGRSFSGGDGIWIEAVTRYEGSRYSPCITIGNNVTVSDYVHIGATLGIQIDDGVLIGSRVTLIDHNHGVYEGAAQSSPMEPPAQRRLSSQRTIAIGKNVWIGEGAVVLPGASIGEGSIIGANSVVLGMIPAWCIAAGSPARPVRTYDFETKEWCKWKQNS